jgi:hypothetical protein
LVAGATPQQGGQEHKGQRQAGPWFQHFKILSKKAFNEANGNFGIHLKCTELRGVLPFLSHHLIKALCVPVGTHKAQVAKRSLEAPVLRGVP